jgi:hypothetical protein
MLKRLDSSTGQAGFDLLAFLEGETRADGIFEDRSGRLKRRFTVDIAGRSEGSRLILDETFHFDDGEESQRRWTLDRAAGGRFTGTCADAPVPAVGHCDGGVASMRSTLRLTVGKRLVAVTFDDVFYPVDAATVLNRSTLSKWGITISQVLILFRKPQRRPS